MLSFIEPMLGLLNVFVNLLVFSITVSYYIFNVIHKYYMNVTHINISLHKTEKNEGNWIRNKFNQYKIYILEFRSFFI